MSADICNINRLLDMTTRQIGQLLLFVVKASELPFFSNKNETIITHFVAIIFERLLISQIPADTHFATHVLRS